MAGDLYKLKSNNQPELVEGFFNFVLLGNTTQLIKKERVKKGVWLYLYFTGIDLAPYGEKPLLFEVSVCGGQHHKERKLCSTLEEAEIGYATFCLMVQAQNN